LVASGGNELDLAVAPFRLTAIVNRVDLRGDTFTGSGGSGEGRFIFAAVDLRNNCAPMPFTVSFEYVLQGDSCRAQVRWGKEWAKLEQYPLGSPQYNVALQAITDRFAGAGVRPTQLPNMSGLTHFRTNETALDESTTAWQMRDFVLVSQGRYAGYLQQSTLLQTPDTSLNGTTVLADYINTYEAEILAGTARVPRQFPPGNPFLAGAATQEAEMFWDAPQINNPEARHQFAMQSCNGCHTRETETIFNHIEPAPYGIESNLSGYLTGIDVVDPADGATVRHFAELEQRALDLDILVNTQCR
jgi:hypothetical protein